MCGVSVLFSCYFNRDRERGRVNKNRKTEGEDLHDPYLQGSCCKNMQIPWSCLLYLSSVHSHKSITLQLCPYRNDIKRVSPSIDGWSNAFSRWIVWFSWDESAESDTIVEHNSDGISKKNRRHSFVGFLCVGLWLCTYTYRIVNALSSGFMNSVHTQVAHQPN